MEPAVKALLAAATRPYRAAGRYDWHFARGKLRHDPVFLSLLREGWLPDQGRLLDLGCGRGLLLALLSAAREQHLEGNWPPHYPPPPAHLELDGVEFNDRHAQLARRALDGRARVAHGDVRDGGFPECSVVTLFDVLMYLEESEQVEVLRGAAAALPAGGLLLLRESDAAGGVTFHIAQWSERMLQAMRGRPAGGLHYRTAAQWTALLESVGFSVRVEPMSEGTPFASVLFLCKKRDG